MAIVSCHRPACGRVDDFPRSRKGAESLEPVVAGEGKGAAGTLGRRRTHDRRPHRKGRTRGPRILAISTWAPPPWDPAPPRPCPTPPVGRWGPGPEAGRTASEGG